VPAPSGADEELDGLEPGTDPGMVGEDGDFAVEDAKIDEVDVEFPGRPTQGMASTT
jgi:hypothetical protein